MVNLNIPGRFRRVAAAFDEAAARARTPCDEISGSDHSPENMADLRDLVESFMEIDGKPTAAEKLEENDSDHDDDFEDVKESLRGLLGGGLDGERRRIAAEVVAASEIVGEKETSCSKRQLMDFLRNKGFDAGLCKSRWEKFGKNPSGKYEYVDVQIDGSDRNRYIVEPNISGEFQIARPTERYLAMIAEVPRVFVGTPRELKLLVRIMCNEMRLSMKHVGVHVPPWRRNGYMQAKWFGHYKRTVNEVTRAKRCGCDSKPRVGFEGLGEPFAFHGCREELRREDDGFKIGRLAIAFGGKGVDFQ
ncbi:PREDICTED: uncharacterized protein LOC104823541 [Tarenaya hassleriana]|uniref:uncharacterized protein LOC104823541 n=1 Tax=Tarenaya hassleriana TaxID=28532 RepID=UPI00053C1BCA|nr:PREDICTED: uncharacterized protein LOC104823541 [Tarenaya hassleriana]